MTRVMIDTTHGGFPAALVELKSLPAGNLIALYDTGSPDINATSGDIAQIPAQYTDVMIDQGFTGSPNMSATIRDCENGAWTLAKAVNKTGWNVPRPTLYIGSPDTVQEAYDLGWRGDVWLALSSNVAPNGPPAVLPGINYVGIQWNFQNASYDKSVIFDNSWPNVKPAPAPARVGQLHYGGSIWEVSSTDGVHWTTGQKLS